ncbi:MAG: FlgD immunoglobulin-like domain containing protein [Candidatus Kapaibacteriota bacterium]|jgi:hypothetical protein
MKRFFSVLVALCVCTGFAFAQEPYTADTTSVMSSVPSSIRPIVNDANPPTPNLAQPSRSATNILHQGTNSVTFTLALNSQSQLAALSEVWVWTGARLYKDGQSDPLGDLDWGGNPDDWGSLGSKTGTNLRMAASGSNRTLTINNIRQFYSIPANRRIARLSFVARTQAAPMPCNQPPARCNQTNNREFSFTTATITSVRSNDVVTSVNAAPNPFVDNVHIYYNLAKAGNVTMKIFNAMGQEVKTLLLSEPGVSGANVIAWYGDDNTGNIMPNGMYMYRIEIDGTMQTGKIILSR